MTTDHELLGAVERCKARMEYGLDHSNGRDLKILCEGIQSLLGEDNPRTVKAWRNMYVSAKTAEFQAQGNGYEHARLLAQESANRFEDAWEKTIKPTGEL